MSYVVVEPLVDRVGIAWLQQARAGNGVRAHAFRDLEQGRSAFSHVRSLVAITRPDELRLLLRRQFERATVRHKNPLPLGVTLRNPNTLLPILIRKEHKPRLERHEARLRGLQGGRPMPIAKGGTGQE